MMSVLHREKLSHIPEDSDAEVVVLVECGSFNPVTVFHLLLLGKRSTKIVSVTTLLRADEKPHMSFSSRSLLVSLVCPQSSLGTLLRGSQERLSWAVCFRLLEMRMGNPALHRQKSG